MRIQSMALIHDKLYRSDDLAGIGFGEYLKELSAHLIRTYAINPDAVTIQVEAADVRLGLNTAIPCGLLVNELVSNSLKHAFPDDRKGEISIKLKPVHDDQVALTVSDNGIGLPDGLDIRKTKSLGMELVVILAEGQLGGSLEEDRTDGTSFRVVFRNV
ncbi:MAG: sensor histidine kinase, partial [Desulfobulbaceae bacterium]|nr:sensor histidine kinase [Desulfobulbaceae bacterium]